MPRFSHLQKGANNTQLPTPQGSPEDSLLNVKWLEDENLHVSAKHYYSYQVNFNFFRLAFLFEMRKSVPFSWPRLVFCTTFPIKVGRYPGNMNGKEKNVSLWIAIYLSHPLRKLFWYVVPCLSAICCSHKAKILLFQECFMSPRNKSSLVGMVKRNVKSLWFSSEVKKLF